MERSLETYKVAGVIFVQNQLGLDLAKKVDRSVCRNFEPRPLLASALSIGKIMFLIIEKKLPAVVQHTRIFFSLELLSFL